MQKEGVPSLTCLSLFVATGHHSQPHLTSSPPAPLQWYRGIFLAADSIVVSVIRREHAVIGCAR